MLADPVLVHPDPDPDLTYEKNPVPTIKKHPGPNLTADTQNTHLDLTGSENTWYKRINLLTSILQNVSSKTT